MSGISSRFSEPKRIISKQVYESLSCTLMKTIARSISSRSDLFSVDIAKFEARSHSHTIYSICLYTYIILKKHLFSCFTILICIFYLPRHELHWLSEVLKSKNKKQRRKGKKTEIRKGGREEGRKQGSKKVPEKYNAFELILLSK